MKITAALAIGLCLIASTGHAQGWAQALTALGAFSQGVQNGQAQRYNMEHGYPATVYPTSPTFGGQSQTTQFLIDGRLVTCIPMGTGFTYCQ